MTVRVAIESFARVMEKEGLGGDPIAKSMTKAYIDRISEIREAMEKKND